MSTDVHGFGPFMSFLYEIGDIIVVLRNFRNYSCDFSYYSSGFRSYSCEMKTEVQGFFRGFQYEIGENIVVLMNFRSSRGVLVLIPMVLDLHPLK